MNHSPAQVVRQLLIDLGHGTAAGSWPIYYSLMPDTPDDCIAITDTEPFLFGRDHVGGRTLMVRAVQVMVRGGSVVDAYTKCKDINVSFDEDVYRTEVTVGKITYLVQAISRLSAEIPVGQEGTSKRRLFSTNARVSVTQLAETGTAT